MSGDGNISNCGADAVPIAQILQSRTDFPNCELSYEVQFSALDWYGIANLATVCARAGLNLLSLRCFANGRAFCVLADSTDADLNALNNGLEAFAGATKWTISILYRPSSGEGNAAEEAA
ncbi:hypothetical protein ACETRX_36275 [Labrys portucalensis]|uniref:ACT domain-containing protein n=1 Tax=Labrys neptuniae TaxID=376174 RepID=A0ABV6ZSA7_9HYPH